MKRLLGLVILSLFAVPASVELTANGVPTRMLRSPSVSATHIAFAYANNIWVVERAGGNARRLTSFQGQTINPEVFSRRRRPSRSAATMAATPTCIPSRPKAASRSG